MPKQLIVTFPATDPTLRRQIEQSLEDYADVRQSQTYTFRYLTQAGTQVLSVIIELLVGTQKHPHKPSRRRQRRA